jgi:branched-subunit amino acid aminotransferase/4-amino-4-deoxychorismate lyase
MEPVALLNGAIIPQSQATLALNDAGFVFGATITDLCRTFHRRLYRWPEHLARFRRGCGAAGIDVPAGDAQLTAWAEELVAHNARLLAPGQELALVVFATPGPVGYYLGEPGGAGDRPATFGMHTFPLPFARYRDLVERGAALVVPGVRHVPAACVDPRLKQRSRLHWWLAEREARATAPGSMALLLNTTGHVTETAAANFLIVRGGTLISPPRESILAGISLAVVEELAGRLGIPMEFRPLTLTECQSADEALLTGTAFCVAGVRSIDGAALPWPGPVLGRLLAAWNAEVGLDLHGQILGEA